ncbi:MAG: hypothetical protein WBB06_02975, partial [Chitinophagaceae bacterium]
MKDLYEGLPIKEWLKKQNKELLELEKHITEDITPLLLMDATKKNTWDLLCEQHGNIEEKMSNCCGAKIIYTNICKECREHCGTVYS